MIMPSRRARQPMSATVPTADEPLLASHRERARSLLRTVPALREYIGPNRATFAVIVALVSAQLAAAFAAAAMPWWLLLPAAYLVGAVLCHALFVMIHDCCHNLVFRRPWLNRLAEFVANIPLVIPCATSFSRAHRQHHIHLGDPVADPDVPFDWEARLIGRSTLGKLLWLATYPLWLIPRSMRNAATSAWDPWVAANIVVQMGVNVALWYFGGWVPVVYLLASSWFSVSLHPLGARWIQEHFMIAPPQRTYSYYGPANWVAFNIGYHNEHHDFPNIPWNRLPQVRRLGGRWYDGLAYHTSWTRLLGRFLWQPQFHLHNRMAPTSEASPVSPTSITRETDDVGAD